MSGDVQPRKRKDKKKKRDAFDRKSEGELSFSRHQSFQEDDESSHGVHITKMGGDDVHLHVHHEHGTGGHWCAKVFFFSLLAILLGLVALIILENRGLSDLDTPLSESRFSNYFDGWVEEHRQDHDDHDPVQASIEEHEEHDEPFEEEEDHSELDEEAADEDEDEDEDDHEDEDEEQASEDGEGDEEQTVEQTREEDDEEEEDDDNATVEATAEEDDADDDDADEDEDADDALQEETVEQTVEEDDNDDDDNDDANNDDDDDDNNTNENTIEASPENAKSNAADDDDDDDGVDSNADDVDGDNDDDDADEVEEHIKPIYTRSSQQTATSKQSNANNNNDDDDDDDDAFDEEDDDGTFESLEKVVDNDAEELLLLQEKARQQAAEAGKNEPASAENDEDDDNAESAPSWANSLAVKIGVGVALALVARLVLIRNNPNTTDEPAPEVSMKRRLTIASAEDTYPDDEDAPPLSDDEYSEEEIEIEEEIEYVEDEEIEMGANDDEEMPIIGKYVPETFEQLNAMYRFKGSELPAAEAERVEELKEEATFAKTPKTATSLTARKPLSPPYAEEIRKVQTPTKTMPAPTTILSRTPISTTTTTPVTEPPKPTVSTAGSSPKPTAKRYIPDSPKPTPKHEVTHDVDCQPDDDDIDYDEDDDIDYDGEEMLGEEEEDDEDIDDDLADDDEEISDVDDTELMNRLEAKYGRLPAKEYESDEDPEDPTWTQIKPKDKLSGGPQAHDDDYDQLEEELRRANEEMMRERYGTAAKAFALLARQHPDRPAAFLGKAQALDRLAELQRSNKLLDEALDAFKRYLAFGALIEDDVAYRAAATRCIERLRFLGHNAQAVPIHEELIDRFDDEPHLRNQLVVTYLLMNRLGAAKQLLQEILVRWPLDGFAQVHYGFVLRQHDKDYENAVIYLRHGIDSKAPGTQDGRFFFNLGDSLQRLGRQAEALAVYERGAALQLFPSAYQRSLYNEPGLRAQPYWTKAETTYASHLDKLEHNWQAVRDEALSVLSRRGYFMDETESLRDTGNWQQFELYARGQRHRQNCQKAPITCSLIEPFAAASGCRRGQVKFSIMQPGTHVHAHCGPTNCRLRAHLGLVVPAGTRLRVADKERTWTEGKFLIFDDSFEHEVWHNGSSLRLVLIVDVWHPDLSAQQRQSLTPI